MPHLPEVVICVGNVVQGCCACRVKLLRRSVVFHCLVEVSERFERVRHEQVRFL